ncbi:hypothetical protein V8C35DRAFT_313627 [Trichoderma chlorosporum]
MLLHVRALPFVRCLLLAAAVRARSPRPRRWMTWVNGCSTWLQTDNQVLLLYRHHLMAFGRVVNAVDPCCGRVSRGATQPKGEPDRQKIEIKTLADG